MSEREGQCRAKITFKDGRRSRVTECGFRSGWYWHDPAWPQDQYRHPYLPPRPTLREWLRDAALWLAPPGWVIVLGVAATVVALAWWGLR